MTEEIKKSPWWKIKSGYDVGRFIIASICFGILGFRVVGFEYTIIFLLALWGFIFYKNSSKK